MAKTKIVLYLVMILSTLMCFVLYTRNFKAPESKLGNIQLDLTQQVAPLKMPQLVAEINEKNKAIRSIWCDSVSLKSWERGFQFRLNGTIQYEKPNRFRMRVSSLFSEELDLGSNDEIFWYWSRRDKKPGVYWAYYPDFPKTRLKTPFSPIFMRTSFGLDEIDTKTVFKVEEDVDSIFLFQQQMNGSNKPIICCTYINKLHRQITGFLITDVQGNNLASCEVQEFGTNGLPFRILYDWKEENRTLLVELTNLRVNYAIDPKNWEPPNRSPKINMANE